MQGRAQAHAQRRAKASRTAGLAAVLTAALLGACGGGGGTDNPPPKAITPGTETLAAVNVQVREGLSSTSQRVLVSNAGVVGNYSWEVLTDGPVQASAQLVAGGVQLSFSVQGVVSIFGAQIEVRYCNVPPCTAQNSLRRIVPVRVDVLRGLSWQLPEPLFFGGQGLRLADQFVSVGLPPEAGTLEVQALEGGGSTAPSTWLQAEVQPGASALERVVRLSSPRANALALGDYPAQLRARYLFADGSAPLQLATDLLLLVRQPGCRWPESSPQKPSGLGAQWGPQWYENILTPTLSIRIECWGIPPSAATVSVDAPWLNATLRGSGRELEAVLTLDRAQAASLPSSLRPSLQLRVASAVQADALIPFTLDIRFADVLAVTPATVRAGVPTEVLLTGANLDMRLEPLLLDAQGRPVPGVRLTPLRHQSCSVAGCDVVVAVPALGAGDWRIGYLDLEGLQRPTGLLRATQN